MGRGRRPGRRGGSQGRPHGGGHQQGESGPSPPPHAARFGADLRWSCPGAAGGPLATVRDRLLASGRVVRAQAPFQIPSRLTSPDQARSASATLAQLREEQAAAIGPAGLPTLDAIHLASALSVAQALTAFVAYDTRLLSAAEALGLVTAAPG